MRWQRTPGSASSRTIPGGAAYLAGIADRLLADAGLQLQPSELALFEEAKAKLERQLGDEFTAIHDDAMAAPLEESLRQGGVLSEVPASP